MKPESWAAIFAGLAFFGQVANFVLFLQIKVAKLETEKELLAQTDCKYPDAKVCEVQMADHERRIGELEERCV